MATIERAADPHRRQRIALIALGTLALAAGVVLYFSLRSPPQIGTSEEVFNTVDALFTAVCNQNEQQLGNCEQRLRAAKEAGKLPTAAWDYLSATIAMARSGSWRPAAESLYGFMQGQRREGAIEPRHEHGKKAKSPKDRKK